MRVRMALRFNNSVQGLDERRHTYMVAVSPHCERTEQVDTQADGADQEQLVRVHLWGVQPARMVSIAGNESEKGH
jgi:hypothetical protein